MGYEVGQRIRLSTVVRDINGVATDATVTVAVYREDGTPYAGTVATHAGSPGSYYTDVTLDEPGRITWEWTATGTVVGKSRDQAYVRTPWGGMFSLTEAKKHLNKSLTDTSDDDELSDWIDAITIALEKEVGPIVPKPYTETFNGGGHSVYLTNTPVVAVTSVSEVWGADDVRVLTPEIGGGPYGNNEYTIDYETGTLTRRGNGFAIPSPYGLNNITVTYTAGRNPIPANIRLAGKELLQHHWRASQLASGRTRPRADMPSDNASVGIGIPHRVKLLIGHKRAPLLGG